jgi:hypothetical protein
VLKSSRVRSFPDSFSIHRNLILVVSTDRQPMERLVVSRQFAEQLFADNPLKMHILRRVIPPTATEVTLYRCGALVDLCRGPHVAHTGVPKCLISPYSCLCFIIDTELVSFVCLGSPGNVALWRITVRSSSRSELVSNRF